jgi:Sec7-like guanine-nucleotide exchange factor
MNGESQLIERILQGLANEMAGQIKQNPDKDFQDTVFSLNYAIIMLNTDLHHPDVIERMKFPNFEKNFRLVCPDEEVVSKAQLQGIFEDIKVYLILRKEN